MPKKRSTAAQNARRQQASSGGKYTTLLRAQGYGRVRHRSFSTSGAGWAPIIERAERRLAEVWPDCPQPLWEEKFGDLCWKYCPTEAPDEVWQVVRQAEYDAIFTCQYCPSSGHRRVVWTWDEHYGWIQPWVKTCCDECSWVPQDLKADSEYLSLVEEYEDKEEDIP